MAAAATSALVLSTLTRHARVGHQPLDDRDDPAPLLGGGTGCAPGRVDSPPTSRRSAPSATSARPCSTAAPASSHRPPSENESGVTLTTPMTAGRALHTSPHVNTGAAYRRSHWKDQDGTSGKLVERRVGEPAHGRHAFVDECLLALGRTFVETAAGLDDLGGIRPDGLGVVGRWRRSSPATGRLESSAESQPTAKRARPTSTAAMRALTPLNAEAAEEVPATDAARAGPRSSWPRPGWRRCP